MNQVMLLLRIIMFVYMASKLYQSTEVVKPISSYKIKALYVEIA